jgi:hypothetical protein
VASGGRTENNDLGRMREEVILANSRCYVSVFLYELRKIHENFRIVGHLKVKIKMTLDKWDVNVNSKARFNRLGAQSNGELL